MAIDPYSACPGGLGKKVKFCCADLIGELDKIDRLRQADQRSACLEHVEKLDARHPGRACLMTTKADLLRELGRKEEADSTVQVLLDHDAGNPVALAEAAILACETEGGAQSAISLVQRALAASTATISEKIVEAIARVSEGLLAEGQFLSGRAHLVLYLVLASQDKQAMDLLRRLDRTPTIPLLLKENRELQPAPEGVAWKREFEQAMEPLSLAGWAEAADRLAELVEKTPGAAVAWNNLAILRGWLNEELAAGDAWRVYSQLEIPEDEAVEAEAMAQTVMQGSVDLVDMISLSYPIGDMDRLIELLLSNSNCVSLPAPMSSDDPDSPPPKHVFLVLDRPMPDAGSQPTLASCPRLLGQFYVFGRQTDREAHIDLLGYRSPAFDRAKAMLAEISFGLLGPGEEEVIAATPLLEWMFRGDWQVPPGCSEDVAHALLEEFRRDALLNTWPRTPLEVLGGKTPEEAAQQGDLRRRVQAAVLVLELHHQGQLVEFDFDELRAKLGIPAPQPIVASDEQIMQLPLARLSRVVVGSLSDEGLKGYYARATGAGAVAAQRKMWLEVSNRPSFAKLISRAQCFAGLSTLTDDTRKSLDYLEQARQAAAADGQSPAMIELQEIGVRLRRREPEEIGRLIELVAQKHAAEPGVRQALFNIMVQLGMIRPDGVPIRHPDEAAGMPAPAAAAAETGGKIWTPESERGGEKSSLWLPGT